MIALSVYEPGVQPRAPHRFGFVNLDEARSLARLFAGRGLVADVYEYVAGGAPRLVERLLPEGAPSP